MTTKFLENAKKLGKSDLKQISGGVIKSGGTFPPPGPIPPECGCSCSGAVTGPVYCSYYIACLQVYNCRD